MKGALHNDDLDHFLGCVDDPQAIIKKFEDAVVDFQ